MTAGEIRRPTFIVSAPCSGADVLAGTLARSPDLVLSPAEDLLAHLPQLRPANRGWDSDRLRASDADAEVATDVQFAYADAGRESTRMLDASPANALRVPFLDAVFGDSLFVFLYLAPRRGLTAMLEAWESGTEVSHPELPGWPGPPWSLPLVPEWRTLTGLEPSEVAAAQWAATTWIALEDLQRLPAERWSVVAYDDFAEDPEREAARLWRFLGAAPGDLTGAPAPPLGHRGTPAPVQAVLGRVQEPDALARAMIATPPPTAEAPAPEVSPLRSVSTTSLYEVLEQVGGSLLVSTYQTNKLVVTRRAGQAVNTHFRALDGPMGMAYRDGRLAVGTRSEIAEYRDVPAAAEQLEGPVPHDACFVPRTWHNTGDVRVHDLAFAGDELWFVATRFSCLATLDPAHSFVPRWTPPFITALAAEDRCHLNGMCVIGDQVRYVTALGASDEPGGWRERRGDGGIVIDVTSGETVAAGLSMPHSPRWHRDRLWLLESGEGSMGTLDPATGAYEPVARVPGFTRGLSFHGSFAFVGLSEVREATTFGGLPLTGRLEARQCGVWVIDIDRGETVAFLRFEDVVEELFEVLVLPGMTFPEIAERGSDAALASFVLPD